MSTSKPHIAAITCPICTNPMPFVFYKELLGRHIVAYYRCPKCELLKTEEPYWLEEAYSTAIADTDVGLVARNMAMRASLPGILHSLFDPKGCFLDYAGGYGMLCRMMRDVGFNFYWQDKHCQNLLAKGCDLPPNHGAIEGITAFEVMEHLPDPSIFIQEIFSKHKPQALIVTTTLYQGETPGLDWWYYSFETGQHISFFTLRTLKALCLQFGLFLSSIGSIHIFSKKPLPRWKLRLLNSERLLSLSTRLAERHMRSLLESDYEHAKKSLTIVQGTSSKTNSVEGEMLLRHEHCVKQ
ncbi:class I SAM-dependent methyltransferase [Desulfovibrio sp. MES5]|uniref:class I SAM-dependent methyltransferase n=1 Tax=Desulfovibrio sp. MES5 TaxID=1899016 RepID=UPI0025C323FD|nr:class I SAM-dependent methyltransferase [Desulfovibrio sp. MES5]